MLMSPGKAAHTFGSQMDRKLKERLVGAAVIVGVAVLLIPEFLSGPETDGVVTTNIVIPGESGADARIHTIILDPPTSQPPAPVPVADANTAAWAVQLGSFASRENAVRLAGELEDKGYEAEVSVHVADGRTLHRVRVGPVSDRESAEALVGRLQLEGVTGRVVPHP